MNADRADQPSPAIDVRDIHRLPEADALRFVDETLGHPESWPSPLISYRLGADFQTDWKVEVGQWLWTAKQYGFLDRVLHDLRTQAQRPSKADHVDPNDERHLKLHQHLAVARVTHYLTALGWGFEAFEPETGSDVDVDLSLRSPDGSTVEFQVKAPDQPGRVENGRIIDGEYDERIVLAVKNAAGQLRRPATGSAVIAVCANRTFPLCWDVGCLVEMLVGTTTSRVGATVVLTPGRRGAFFTEQWSHVSAVVVLDLVRRTGMGVTGADLDVANVTEYAGVVLVNPNATFPLSESWFPRAQLAQLNGETFRWVRGEPGDLHTLSDGTILVD